MALPQRRPLHYWPKRVVNPEREMVPRCTTCVRIGLRNHTQAIIWATKHGVINTIQ